MIMFNALEQMEVASVHVLLDKPVSNSGRLKTLIAEIGENKSFDLDIQVLDEVDNMLWEKDNVITSDSIILDNCRSWVNLMKNCVETYNAKTFCVWEK